MSSASASDTSGVDTSGAEAMYDVIVVGGGGSGLAAATSAAENGASALLLERESELGGTTGIAVGSFTANRTRLQQAAGVTDSLADHAQDAGQFAPAEIEAFSTRSFAATRGIVSPYRANLSGSTMTCISRSAPP